MNKKNRLYYLERYTKWEEKRKLFNWKISGTSIWEYIRFGVFGIIDCKINDIGYYDYYYYIKENSNKVIPRFFEELPKKFLTKKDVLFVNMSRRQEINNIYYSPYIDGLVTELNYSYSILEARPLASRNINIITPNVIYYDPDNLAGRKSKRDYVDSAVKRLVTIIEKDFKIVLSINDKECILNNVYSVLQNRKRFHLYYKIILEAIKPKVIIIVGAALQYNRYLIEVAKKLNIPTVEYDHGYASAYCMENYYNKLHDLKSYVDHRWCYGKKTIYSYKLPIKSELIVAVGNEFHNQRVKQIANERYLDANDNRKNVLVISDYMISSKLAELAIELADRLDNSTYQVTFKLHPGETDWRNKYPCLLNSSARVKGIDSRNDINYYIMQSYCVIGTTSTALVEAVELSKNVYIYEKSKYAICSEFLYKNEYATLFSNTVELIGMIEKQQPFCINKKLYEKKPIQNINREIKKIIKI